MICWEPTDKTSGSNQEGEFVTLTNYFLLSLWRTRCNKPRLDAVVFCFFNRRCYRVFNFIPWMKEKFTNPSVLLPEVTHKEIYEYVANLTNIIVVTISILFISKTIIFN